MPAYQSVPAFDLSERASGQTTGREWQELATQWHTMANQAAKMSENASQDEFE
jgi:hypothetical protein